MAWTDERVATLKKLWGDGKTASEIADVLGDVTRNAVIGKAHRLGLSGRPSPIKKTLPKTGRKIKSPAPKKAAKPAAVPAAEKAQKTEKNVSQQIAPTQAREQKVVKAAPTQPSAVPLPQPIRTEEPSPRNANGKLGLLDLSERTCRWPIGDPREKGFHFCGKAVSPGVPYCDAHIAMAYQTPKKKKA